MKPSSRVRTLLLVVALGAIALSLLGSPGRAAASTGVVRFYVFYSAECIKCQAIKNEFLPPLLEKYGSQLEPVWREISDPAVMQQLIDLERQFQVPAEKADIPEIFLGSQALIGEDDIRARLPGLIDEALAAGGVDLPQAASPTPARPTPGPVTNANGKPVARWTLFYSETCPHCHEVMENYLPKVYDKYGDQVEHREIEINQGNNYQTMLGVETVLGVPQDNQGYVPALAIGDQMLVGGDEIPARLETLIDQYLAQGGVDYVSLENLPVVVPPTPAPAVQALLFFHPQDPGLADLQTFFGQLSSRFGTGFQLIPFDRSSAEYAKVLGQLVTALGNAQPGATDPVVLVDRQLIVGAGAIKAQLPGLIEQYLAQGGKSLPSLEEITGGASRLPTAVPTPARPVYMAYFEKAGCQECARTNYDLKLVQKQYPQVVVESYPIESNQPLNQWLSEKFKVPQNKWLTTPMIFVGTDVLIGTDANAQNLLTTIARYTATGAPRSWEQFDKDQALQKLIGVFKNWGPLTVVGAGLIDGLNPCAFATLIFFISYMAFTGRRGRDILFVGLAFTVGVFLTYLLVGVGLSQIITAIPGFSSWGRWVYLLTGLLCVVLAALTFRDYVRARQGQASEMTLKLPGGLRKRINKVIREGAQMRAFVPIAFLTGFVVSLIELACTGQVYLPTIMFVLSVPEIAARAFVYLLVYCLAFIVPLVVVFVLSYLGTTSDRLTQFLGKHIATVKALTGALFVALALWMAWAVAPLFGLNAPWNWILLLVVLVAIGLGVVATRPWVKPAPKRRPATRQAKQRRSRA